MHHIRSGPRNLALSHEMFSLFNRKERALDLPWYAKYFGRECIGKMTLCGIYHVYTLCISYHRIIGLYTFIKDRKVRERIRFPTIFHVDIYCITCQIPIRPVTIKFVYSYFSFWISSSKAVVIVLSPCLALLLDICLLI